MKPRLIPLIFLSAVFAGTLPVNELYGDASHPLTAGYEQLAKEIFESPGFSTRLE